MKKYYTPSFSDMVVGFKCETCYSYFLSNENIKKDEWIEIEFTKDFYDKYIGLIKSDAYESEFRVPIMNKKKTI